MNGLEQFESALTKAIEVTGIKITDQVISLLAIHYNLLRKWNSTFNLTSLEKPDDIIDRLYVDSLYFLNDLPEDLKVLLDIGSGPGFPGIPILAAKPDINLSIIEPRRKMCSFLSEVQYGFKNMLEFKVINERCDSAEFVETNNQRYPVIISKAFTPLEKAFDLILPILKPGGLYATCINPETPLNSGVSGNFKLLSDVTLVLPLTRKPTRHLVFQHNKNPA